jgi:hypothetical protein
VAREVLVPVLLDELEEFEVVLHLAFYQRLDADRFVDLVLGKRVCWSLENVQGSGPRIGRAPICGKAWRTLQYLEILQVLILSVCIELDSAHGHIVYTLLVLIAPNEDWNGRLTEYAVKDLA